MKKIGIATQYTDSCNYGGVLQAYALCSALKNLGYNAVQINYNSKGNPANHRIICKIRNGQIFDVIYNRIKRLYNKIVGSLFHISNDIKTRNQSFCGFRSAIPHTDIIYNDATISSCNEFDIYITGSDQVWRIGSSNSFSIFYWLAFVNNNKKKISYAASISEKEFPEKLYSRVRKLLTDYSAISVREKQDKELLDKIIGKDKAKWVLDPTLLLKRNEWEQLCDENPFNDKRYVFTYILGDNKKQRKTVTEWAKKNNRIIINIPYLLGQYRGCDRKFGDIKKSDVTPNLWLSLIRDADCVFTDSFHACVFSSIFHTPFYVFKRCKDSSKESMNSRIYSLMELFGTEDRIIEDNAVIESLPNLKSIDFEKLDSQVAIEKKKSLDFLINTIEG